MISVGAQNHHHHRRRKKGGTENRRAQTQTPAVNLKENDHSHSVWYASIGIDPSGHAAGGGCVGGEGSVLVVTSTGNAGGGGGGGTEVDAGPLLAGAVLALRDLPVHGLDVAAAAGPRPPGADRALHLVAHDDDDDDDDECRRPVEQMAMMMSSPRKMECGQIWGFPIDLSQKTMLFTCTPPPSPLRPAKPRLTTCTTLISAPATGATQERRTTPPTVKLSLPTSTLPIAASLSVLLWSAPVGAGILSGFSGLESVPGPELPRVDFLSKWNEANQKKYAELDSRFRSSKVLQGLLEKSRSNKEKNQRKIQDKYCLRGAEWGIGDCSTQGMTEQEKTDFIEALKERTTGRE